MAPPIDVRAALAAELRRLVRESGEWPIRDRRRFRNLLLDAVTSDAMPIVELLLRADDDGMVRGLPERTAARSVWEAAAGRLASDLQVQRFVEPGIARFVADAWMNALGPDPAPSARVATPRALTAPRAPVRPGANAGTLARPVAPSSQSNAASMLAYRRANRMIGSVALICTVLVVLAFVATNRRASPPSPATTAMPEPAPQGPVVATRVETATASPAALPGEAATMRRDSVVQPRRAPVSVAAAPARTTDDIVLSAGRVFEGRVLSVRQQSVLVKDEQTGLDFEIPKADIDRIVTRDGRVMRFGDDNIPLIDNGDDLTPASNSGTYRLRYAERWGADRRACREMASEFAPGATLLIRHLRGAPMMKLEFVNGPGFNAAVRPDGLFETGAAVAPARGPLNSFVSSRISGRVRRSGELQGVARVSAVTADGSVVCDVALTVVGERVP